MSRQTPVIRVYQPSPSMPAWAVLQRDLIALMNRSEEIILEHYLRPNGEIFWPDIDGFRGYGGVDNAFEGFHRWPLFYLLGGDDRFLELAQRQYEVLIAQFSRVRLKGSPQPPGRDTMLVDEYLPDFDWMHAGEAALFFYLLNLADPTHEKNRERSLRFAGYLTDPQPDWPESSYDPQHRVFRTYAMGSNGPAFHRVGPYGYGTWMDHYGLAFYDVPGVRTLLDLRDAEKARRYGEAYWTRLGRCDTVTNLLATSMVMNAYLHTGDEKYRQWVLDYVDGWRQRYAGNGGVMPDNAGPTGAVGETIDGKWYGGHYGWTFPHGFHFIGDAMVIGGQNERLLTGAAGRLDWVREQVEMLLGHAIEAEDGRVLVPQKYADPDAVIEYAGNEALTRPDRVTEEPGFNRKRQVDGWFEFRRMDPSHMAHAWADSLDRRDVEVTRRLRGQAAPGIEPGAVHGKNLGGQYHAWVSYLAGEFAEYPEQMLRFSLDQVYGQLRKLRAELDAVEMGWGYRPSGEQQLQELAEATRQVNAMKAKPWSETVTHSYFQTYLIGRSTIVTEALVQQTMGGPLPIYNGGLLRVAVRHFDAARRRPGLPPDTAALVRRIDTDGIDLTLANLHPMEARRVLVQAGAFGEHDFTSAAWTDRDGRKSTQAVDGPHAEFDLGPGTVLEVRLGMARYVRQPSYRQPWEA